MLHALSMLAAAAGEEEPSKTPFYVVGALLVAFAVIVSAVGITRGGFPATKGAQRAVIALGALLVAATMATAVVTA